MRKEARLLLEKATDSLILGIEHFNRPWDRGRIDSVLIMMDHAFEMLLKAAILHRGGRIRLPRAKQTIGFDDCVRRALSDGRVKFINENQALTLQVINGLRDASQHHLVHVSEAQLYMHAQAAVTLFRDLLKGVFDQRLADAMPERVLPVSTLPPRDLAALFDDEVEQVRKLVAPRSRRRTEAGARLRALAIMEGSIQGERLQPGEGELRRLMTALRSGKSWPEIFPGVASMRLDVDGAGPSLSLRLTKKEGVPTQLVPEGAPGAAVIAVKRVDELGFYNLGHNNLAAKVGLSAPKTTAVVRSLNLQKDPKCFKEIVIGKAKFGRYSQEAIARVKDAIAKTPIEEIWSAHRPRAKQRD